MRGMRALLGAFAMVAVLVLRRHAYGNIGSAIEYGAEADRQSTASFRPDLYNVDNVEVDGCSRIFIDGGSNMGEAVTAWLSGKFFQCALTGPSRIYASNWVQLTKQQQRQQMAPLSEPESFCIRSFEVCCDRTLSPFSDDLRRWYLAFNSHRRQPQA